MFGVSGYLGVALAASLAATAAAGWLAWHEHGIAVAQASRDRAKIAQVEAHATANALAQQQAIDKSEAAKVAKLQAEADQATAWLNKYRNISLAQASSANQTVRTIIRTEPATACARQPIPGPILAKINE